MCWTSAGSSPPGRRRRSGPTSASGPPTSARGPTMQPENGQVPTPVLQLIGARAAYGRIQVLHGVDLTVPKGSVLALLGPNGAGKTTTIRLASGQLRPTAG